MKPRITVVVMTYNHVAYIRKTLDSILSQKVNCFYNILIHDDCSNDGTTQIILEYQQKNHGKINCIIQKNRQFLTLGYNEMIKSFIVPNLVSDYVAICDGDDYWIDNNKLQKQLDFMDANNDYSMCFHSAYQLKPSGDIKSKWYIKNEGDIDLSDIISYHPGVCAATSSIFVRTSVYCDFPRWRTSFPVEDLPLCIDAALFGKIHRFKEIMCVYRQFSNGSWSQQNQTNPSRMIEQHNALINSIKLFNKATNYSYQSLINSYIDGCEFRLALLKNDLETVFNKHYRYILKKLPFRDQFVLSLKFHFPGLYNLCHRKK